MADPKTYSYRLHQIQYAQSEFERQYDIYLHHKSSGNDVRVPNLFEILEQTKNDEHYLGLPLKEFLKSRKNQQSAQIDDAVTETLHLKEFLKSRK